MENERWTRQIIEACPVEHLYPAFLEHISPIGIEPDQIKGKVLVIGQGMAFPETSLIATPETHFEKLRETVDTVYCCDTTYPSSPELHLDYPCVNTIFYDRIPNPEPNTTYYELSSSYTFLPKVDKKFFDTILMFRIVDLGTQINEQRFIERIAPYLKVGGYFIGSGGRFPTTPPDNFYDPLTLVKSVKLSNFSDGYPFTENTGVVLYRK